MGSSTPTIKVVIIDLSSKEDDFKALKDSDNFQYIYYDNYDKFLEKQSLKELSYIIIREKKQEHQLEEGLKRSYEDLALAEKRKQSSVVAQTYDNLDQLGNEFQGNFLRKEPPLRQKLITYMRKYSLQRLLVYLLVDDFLNFKLPEYEEPYITMITDNVNHIKRHLEHKPQGAEPTLFKFKRMVKDLYRRTVVKIISTQANEELAKSHKKEWSKCLGKKITMNFSTFNEDEFKESLISNYYDFIVVGNSRSYSFIQDMKRLRGFQSQIIYFGNLSEYGKDEYEEQTEEKLEQIKAQIWMHNSSIQNIAKAIRNCTDIKGEQTQPVAKNVVVYTELNYGKQNQAYFIDKLREKLKNPTDLKQVKSKDIHESRWRENLDITIVSQMQKLKYALKRSSFSYLITFDSTILEIQHVKAYLRKEKYDKRVYMYNADEKEGVVEDMQKHINNKTKVEKYLDKRIDKIVEKAAFRIKFQIGPIDEITTYKLSSKQNAFFKNELGLMTSIIESRSAFEQYYMSQNRELIISGFCLVMRVKDYFNQWKEFMEEDLKADPSSYFPKVKIIIVDEKKVINDYWDDIVKETKKDERIAFVNYNLARVRDYLEILSTPRINLTIFIKKALPNFYRAYQKLMECKYKRIQLTASIVSKNSLLKEVFQDENFKLSKHHRLSFLKLANTNKNMDQALTVLHQEFLYRYGIMWRTGYDIVGKNKKDCLFALKEDIKYCLYKLKAYMLIDVSEQQFQYFYTERLQACHTYIDLQIAIIYIFSLPHGLFNVIQLIFTDPLSTCLTPKMCVGLVVTLMTAFCSFKDQVMNKKRFLIYMDDTNRQDFIAIMSALKIGDVLFNNGFIFAGNDQENAQSFNNHCLYIEFEDIPMLSETHIKNYLHMEPFSFYKQSTEYLIAPYTQFTVKNIQNTPQGKVHITLSATRNTKKGFVSKVFTANEINQEILFQTILNEASEMKNNTFTEQESERIKKTSSLYKKSELIGQCEEKLQLTRSIRQGLQYKLFLRDLRNKKLMTALSHLKKKQQSQKGTTELQAAYFSKMLGVEKAMLYYAIGQYDMSINELDKVIKYLFEQRFEEGENWVIRKIKAYKKSVHQLSMKRHKYLNRFQKVKKWTITPCVEQDEKDKQGEKKKLCVTMKAEKMIWNVGYNKEIQQFYIQQEDKDKFYAYNAVPPFGDLATAFPPNSTYQTLSQRLQSQQEKIYGEKKARSQLSEVKQKINNLSEAKNSEEKDIIKPTQSNLMEKTNGLKKTESFAQNQLPDLCTENATGCNWLFDSKKNLDQRAPESTTDLPIKSRMIEVDEEDPFKTGQASLSKFAQSESQFQLSKTEVLMGVRQKVHWQAFFFDGKFVLTKKGKHYKAKMPNKHHL